MGQKVNPHGLRVGVIKDWDSKWFAGKREFGDQLVEDYNIRKFVKKACYDAGVAKTVIERKQNKVYITLYVAKPGFVIGKGGAEIDKLKTQLEKMTSRSGKAFYGCSGYPTCNFMSWDMPNGEYCPKCNSYIVLAKDGKTKKCSNKECDHIEKPLKKKKDEKNS